MAATAVDADAPQYHLPLFASQFVRIGFVGGGSDRTNDFGSWIAGSGDLDPTASQQILEEGLGGLILSGRGGCPDRQRRAGDLKTLRLGGSMHDNGRDAEAIFGHRKVQGRQRRQFRPAHARGDCALSNMPHGYGHRRRQDTMADERAAQRHVIALGRVLARCNTDHGRGDLAEKGRDDGRGPDTLH